MARYRPVSGRLAGLRGRITDEDDGVVLVMVAMSLGVVLALMSMVIVLGSIYVAQRQAQGAADAAALGAAQDLNGAGDSTQDTSASSDGTTVAEQNDPNSTVQVTAPYNGDATTVQVVVTKTVGLPFGFRTNVSATADARNNVVNNGSFDANFSASWIEYCAANGVTSAGPYASACPAVAPDMGSWTVYAGGVDLNHTSYIPAPSSDPNAQSIDMVGSCSYDSSSGTCTNDINGEIYEPLSTIPSDTYTLNFELSENPHGPPASKPMAVYVSPYDPNTYGLARATQIAQTDGGAAGENWTPETYTFVATADTTYLWFVSETGCVANGQTAPNEWTAVASNCNNGAAITDISVTGPETDNLTQ